MGRFLGKWFSGGWWPFQLVVVSAILLAMEDKGHPQLQLVVEAARLTVSVDIPQLPSTAPPIAVPPVALPPIAVPPAALPPIAVPPGLSQSYLDEFNQVGDSVMNAVKKNFSFCIVKSDQRNTYGATQTSAILQSCAAQAGPDFASRICEQSEIELYFSNIQYITGTGLPPTVNCNSSFWPQACDPGWAGTTTINFPAIRNLPTSIPLRSANAAHCCKGFFCPRGLTCMIPCPLGSWCPLAFPTPTGGCYPYGYSAKPGDNNSCGGADSWLNFKDSPGVFCGGVSGKQGKYCPDPTIQKDCERSHYCRTGSTVQSKCLFFTHCGKEDEKSQNIKSYGIMLVVVLFVSLLLVYNFSDQVMHIRERRKNKVRDVAAREAKESVSAVERWKRAKEVAMSAGKKAVMFPADVRRSMSRNVSKVATLGRLSPRREEIERDDQSLDFSADNSEVFRERIDEKQGQREQVSHLLSDPSEPFGKGRLPWSDQYQSDWSDLYPVEGPSNHDLYESVRVPPVLSGADSRGEGALPAAKELELRNSWAPTLAQTRSQIYKYAYGQIEKEQIKQQSKPASVKELVDSEAFKDVLTGKGRLQMELSFVDLCLHLKGTEKRVLSYVTGKFSPSRVTAVMGPSGAGKTLFLTALAGKETGCRISGHLFFNRQPASVRSFRRIIGFVPQDDIVHGSLTVEENLAFSAKYRLPVNTPRQERVLVVERIINRLGLTSIRDSLVGTVENRGISGGQRKRVNVGLELVIEPSVLLLDEPTSGLDSTSSRLVVQSLRREAALGVNVCLVLHQPSYALFRMFDDVMFLAKGGYTIYMGPVLEIEGYFSGLGFEVPDRTNPPDYFMDVAEGLIVPDNNPSFDIKSLPVLWMCHKGYNIPLDIQEPGNGKRKEKDDPRIVACDTYTDAPKSFLHEVWDELRINVMVRWDILKHDLSRSRNLSGRQTPGFGSQFFLIFERVTKQRFRESRLLAQDYIILLLAGICLGFMANWTDETMGGQGYMYTIITVSLLVMIASLRTFAVGKLEFWRESSSGINRLAFFLAKDTVDHFNTIVKPFVYLSMFYFFNDPRSTFISNYVVTLVLIYCCTGMAYVVAIILKPQPGQLICVFVPVVATLLVTEPRTGTLGTLSKISYSSWALQAYTIANAERYAGVWLITRCETLIKYNYRISNTNLCLGILIAYGFGARIVAFLCLVLFHRKQQK